MNKVPKKWLSGAVKTMGGELVGKFIMDIPG